MTAYRLDRSWRRTADGRTVVAGSPLRVFRLTDGGAAVIDRLDHAHESAAADRLLDRFVAAGALHPSHSSSPFTVDDVSVVMPFHEHRGDGRVDAPAGLGVVVVDDASPLRPLIPRATVVERATNGGPAAARNTGLRSVTTPIVAFVDADVTLPDDPAEWLDPLLAHFTDPRVAMVAPRVRSVPGGGRLARYEVAHSPLDLGDEPARVEAGTRVSYVPAAVLVCRTDVVRDLGGFDEGLRFGEDVDLVWRATRAGHRVRYEPTVVVGHRPRPDWPAWARQRLAYGSSAAALSMRHHGAVAPVRLSPWSALLWLLVVLRRPVLAVGVAVGTVVALQRRLSSVPGELSARLVVFGHLAAGRQLAAAVRRVWWPLALVAALLGRRARRVVGVVVGMAVVVPAVVDALRTRRVTGSWRSAADAPIALADDVVYGAGVWAGVWRTGEVGAVLPALTTWPRRGDG